MKFAAMYACMFCLSMSTISFGQEALPESFFPFGLLHSIDDNEKIDADWTTAILRQGTDWREHYVNTACLYGLGMPPGKFSKLLDLLGPMEIKVWGFMYMPLAYLPKCPEVPKNCQEFLTAHQNDPRILAYTIKDEPKKEHEEVYKKSVSFIKQYDPNHQVVSIFYRNDSLLPYLDVLETICMDTYPIRCRTHDPWWVEYHTDDLRNVIGDKKFWYCLQGHSFYGKDYINHESKEPFKDLEVPTVPEFRLMSWLSVAEGADGVIWFLYKWPATWSNLNGDGLVSMIEKPGPLWGEIKHLGWTMEPIGRLLVGSKVCTVPGIHVVNNKTFRLPMCDFAVKDQKRSPRSVITLHARQHPNRKDIFLFVVNNDLQDKKTAVVHIPANRYLGVYNLQSLQMIDRDEKGDIRVELLPGDAEVFLLSEASVFDFARKSILKERCRLKHGEAKVRMNELVRAGVLPETSQAAEKLSNNETMLKQEHFMEVLKDLDGIMALLQQTIDNHREFHQCLTLLGECSNVWSKASEQLSKRTLAIHTGRADSLKPFLSEMESQAKAYMSLRDEILGYKKRQGSLEGYVTKLNDFKKRQISLNKKIDRVLTNIPEDRTDLYVERYRPQ